MAKATFVAACWDPARGQGVILGSFPNTPDGFAQWVAMVQPRLQQGQRPHVVLEPTGGYELALADFVLAQGWLVSLPNPAAVRAQAKSEGRRAKTDRQDALLLARYGLEKHPPHWQPLAQEVSELDSLQRRKEELEQAVQRERNRLQHLHLRPHVAPAVTQSVERLLHTLDEELRTIEQAIGEHLRQHPALQAHARRLRTLPGVGPATVIPLLVLLTRWHTRIGGRGDAAGLVAYVGLDPQPYESGTSVSRRPTISRQGAHTLRHQLFMAALGGVRGANALRAFYQRLVSRGKAKKLALLAAARKLVIWAWAVYRTGQPYNPAKLAHLTAPLT